MNLFLTKNWVNGVFNWQQGYGVFSYGHSQIDNVCQYVFNQEQHHKKKTFREEYLEFLEKFAVPFEEEYLLIGLNSCKRGTYGAIENLDVLYFYKHAGPYRAFNNKICERSF